MKKNVLALLLLACAITSQAQGPDNEIQVLDDAKLKVIYRLTYIEDTNQLAHVDKEKMILLIGNDVSWFQSYNHYRMDHVVRQKRQEGTLDAWRKSGEGMRYASKLTYSVYKNYPTGKTTTTDLLSMTYQWCLYEEPLPDFQWEIMEDTTEIIGFHAQKAVCDFGGRTWEAWFAEELPFNDGPYKFSGLPGLILSIADTQNHYRFELVSVEAPDAGTKIEFEEQEYMKTTKEDFFGASTNDVDNIVDEVMGSITTNGSEDAMRRRIYEIIRSKNNPIERGL
ncbi:MAG: GLPGLI family protein [Bacteroidales bacterium]|nr:GLPGLI family protein [Bacteroidales bacterium]